MPGLRVGGEIVAVPIVPAVVGGILVGTVGGGPVVTVQQKHNAAISSDCNAHRKQQKSLRFCYLKYFDNVDVLRSSVYPMSFAVFDVCNNKESPLAGW